MPLLRDGFLPQEVGQQLTRRRVEVEGQLSCSCLEANILRRCIAVGFEQQGGQPRVVRCQLRDQTRHCWHLLGSCSCTKLIVRAPRAGVRLFRHPCCRTPSAVLRYPLVLYNGIDSFKARAPLAGPHGGNAGQRHGFELEAAKRDACLGCEMAL